MLRRATLLLLLSGAASSAQAPYPTPPRPLGEADEIALAVTAAPPEISGKADVFVLRGTDFVKAKAGTNGCACMVGRDSHDGSRYPICFDQEGAKTTLFREMMESSLRAKGKTEAQVKQTVDAAFAKGELKMPAKTSVAYMMSPKQVLFSSADADGKRVGAWSPHIMVMLPGVMPDQLGLAAQSSVDIIQISTKGDHHSELVVKVPKWSDGTPVKP